MIAYFDSSSIVKWFFDETYADISRALREDSELFFTSIITYPEVMSAINRAGKEGRCTNPDMTLARNEFFRIWPLMRWLNVSSHLIHESEIYIFKHNLRGFDAIHLSSALLLKRESGEANLFFSCFDRNLNKGARKEGLFIHRIEP